jgi:putative transposase
MPSEVRKLKHLEEENVRLRRLVSDLSLDKEILQEVLKKSLRPAQERKLVYDVRTCFRGGTRRACRVLNLHRSRRPEQAVLRKRIREIVETGVRYGYRRIHMLLQREGWCAGLTRVYRLYRLEGLQIRHKSPRRRGMAKLREDRVPAIAPNDCWSMDWMYDQLFDGRRLWVLALVDNFSRVCPALWVGHQARTSDVVSMPNRAVAAAGREASGWTTVASLPRESSICGPTRTVSSWTSADLASRQTMHSLKASTLASGLNA